MAVLSLEANNAVAAEAAPGVASLIASRLAESPQLKVLTQRDIERVVGVILERMIEALEEGGRVELRGFGALSVRSRDARAGRNPRTGEPVYVRAKHVPFFKSGKELRQRLNLEGDAEQEG